MFKGLYASLYVDNTASYTRVKQLKLAHLLNTLSLFLLSVKTGIAKSLILVLFSKVSLFFFDQSVNYSLL